MILKFTVEKGCADLNITKGMRGTATLTSNEVGVRVDLDINGGETRLVYLSGNRKNVPTSVAGRTYNAHKGNPLKYITLSFA